MMSVFTRLKNDPYWISLIPQLVMFLVIIGTWYWGSMFLAIVVLGVFGLLFGKPIRRVRDSYEAALAKDPDGIFRVENFHFRMPMGSPWLPEKFTEEEEKERSRDFYFDFWVYLFHFNHFVLLFASFLLVAQTESYLVAVLLGVFWFSISPQMEAISHEFIHRRSYFTQMLGGAVWATFCYGTFLVEHCMGHHVHVSTPEDPSSAPRGMSIYRFLPRAMILNPVNGFKLEAKRLRERELPVLSKHNRLIWLSLFSLVVMATSYLVAGYQGLVFFLVYTLFCILTIEVANYGMHYGLQRRKLENGRYERVSPLHSWNREGPGHIYSANLTRHSDHHAFPRRPYAVLRNFPEAPQLPITYMLVLTLPFYPKLWFNVMNPHVDAHMEKLKAWRDANIDDYQLVMGIASDRVTGA